ncbi:hypothetical protein L0664_16500 [Octadecabacter sp. G9-8]|uniref:Uncharacterized protein n=1 Tax=Octadecabacter dasysiphoniae TaxID=2909341 RepID=A0ABS9CZP7_9RHOB|nr:hypothetical protein [Octadecabacter dasysiphoniae]MCF2872674.1 hypothetical protein [Octadecabacter dasysiphoniae]
MGGNVEGRGFNQIIDNTVATDETETGIMARLKAASFAAAKVKAPNDPVPLSGTV